MNTKTLLSPDACILCPRACKINRNTGVGACGCGVDMQIAKIMLHRYEEPPISGTRGSGAIFFRGCNLQCGYCQNAEISHGVQKGATVTAEELAEKALQLQKDGAHNINLVTAAHFLPRVLEFLHIVKPHLHIPVVYNSSGYERAEAIRLLDGLVDIYLPDFKYCSTDTARKYSGAADYPAVAEAAIAEMVRQTGAYTECDGLAVRGTIIRHLVLPGLSHDGVAVMHRIAELFPTARVSVMRQYTPEFNRTGDRTLNRKVTTLEYNRVLSAAADCGLAGFMQGTESATSDYTPNFSE